ncbi:LD-carboxypeptidase [Propioniciclava sp.]|uniref:LD-carboxypeptidase n=1 Tax=Propioniciclava sp. TaxID=2038686 RepID=UPI00344E3C2A
MRAILTTIGGEDEITVIPHLDASTARSDPKPFLGYSDNTNILGWLWTQVVPGFYGGATQVTSAPGRAWTSFTPPRCAQRCSRESASNSPNPVSRRTSGTTGTTRGRCSSSAYANPPSPGRGRTGAPSDARAQPANLPIELHRGRGHS